MDTQQRSVHDQLIRAGLDELNQYGPQNFSVRRIASKCGVSCAAPYKHFQNKRDFLAAIIEYANKFWAKKQRTIMQQYASSTREQLLHICKEYIVFLVENPYFRSALMLKDEFFDKTYLKLKSSISRDTKKLITKYCTESGMSKHASMVKVFVVRSIIYGAALMLDNGELPNTPEILDEIVRVIEREFDLP